MKLTPEEKRGLLEDARDLSRRDLFRRARSDFDPQEIERSIQWLAETARAFRQPVSMRTIRYTRILL